VKNRHVVAPPTSSVPAPFALARAGQRVEVMRVRPQIGRE
jgi:hypothetical protein